MPLDVAVDDYGVTFAGASRAWSRIRRFHVKSDHIELDREAGPLLLGPGSPAIIDRLAIALREHLGPTPQERLVTLESVECEMTTTCSPPHGSCSESAPTCSSTQASDCHLHT